ncbi:unnamed protein product [Pelagomonas calceolata]|uniref:tRNA pseudouridine(55) synthase n=2 Tax=Pelagomonas calceolata TaxID=35677 RepID=A0A8J2SVH2_9STRA|nr:unnamed protein product [Pelagomonas calceolata]
MAAEQEPVYLIVAENATTCRNILARGGCDRCALRHCAPPWALYDAAPATLRGALRSALDVPQNEGCSLCLGALAETTARAVAHASSEHAGLGAARGWALRVAAPPSWAVRDAAAGGTTHSVKDALRRVVAADLDRLSPPSNSEAAPPAPCYFDLAFDGAPDDVAALPARLRPKPPKQKGRGKRPRRAPEPVPAARVAAALEALDADERAALASILTTSPPVRVDVKCAREPVYLAFRYRKLGRRTPQSSWVVDGRVKGVGSVEEYVCKAAKAVADCDGVKFAASGREDWDVRMLGNGRPAYAELQNCRKWSSTDVVGDFAREVAKASNGVVEALHVEIADKARADAVNASAETKVKTYACVVWFSADRSAEDARRVSASAPLAVQQRTPVRVMHSRSLATREKRVLRLKLTMTNPRFGVLELDTSAGMYIKEFVHGDLGRTEPSLASLAGCDADILQLDVLDVHDDVAAASSSS